MNYRLRTAIGLVLLLSSSVKADEPKPPTFSVYGFVLPTISVATGGVESFSQQNQSAPTAAGNPILATSADQSRATFQVAQSRVGFVVSPEESVSGRIEVDFIDFTKASPTTAALPRLRRGLIEYRPSDVWTFRFGQDWDLVSPLAPHTFNYVGHYFESGDIGFMRIGIQALNKSGNWEHAFGLGLPGNNSVSSEGLLELGLMPTVSVRETYTLNPKSHVGFSAIAVGLRADRTSSHRLFSGAATLFYDAELSEGLEMRSEAFVGQNTANIGLLGLSYGNAVAKRVQEAGGYVTLRLKVSENSALFGGAGGSVILNPHEMLASYSTSAAGVSSLAGTGPGIESNWTARVGCETQWTKSLKGFVEFSGMATRHHLLAADARVVSNDRKILITEVGTQLTF